MTATDPRSRLAAMPAARPAPAAEALARCLDSAGSAHPDGREAMTATPPHDKT